LTWKKVCLRYSRKTSIAGSRNVLEMALHRNYPPGTRRQMEAGQKTLPATDQETMSVRADLFRRGTRRRGRRNTKSVWFLWLLAGVPLLGAEIETTPQPLRLTLRDALQLALKKNPEVQIGALNLAESRQDEAIARSELLPQLSFQATERVSRENTQALFGTGFPGIPQHLGPFENFQAGAYFAAPIFDLTLWRRWRASRELVQASHAQVESIREQYAALVVSQYFGSLRASASVQAAKSRIELAQALYQQTKDLQKSGVGTGIDTLRANVELQHERQNLIMAQTALETSLYGLVHLLDLDPGQPVELADTISFFETPSIEVDASLAAAYKHRPEMQALRAQDRALDLEKQAVRAERLPAGRFEGFWASLGLSPTSVIPSYSYQASVSIPLFTGGQIGAELARAEIERKKNAKLEQEQRNAIALEVRTAIAQLEAARQQVDVANLAVQLASEEVSQARDRFQAGVANNIEVIQAQDVLARANDDQILALYSYNQARADLAHATGQMQNFYPK
jgi:outer membrane protein TolC